eukprot:TRINITY_DN1433_c0_g2_i1.p1 TRINITY_DN1433_c0_g2~~TRINITY_DN1433_c0_g2_i1.p1  ORF type:complete len:1216 (+),score=278.93 TRINITY_DN1433_c0_g2_i1:548-3649(+)
MLKQYPTVSERGIVVKQKYQLILETLHRLSYQISDTYLYHVYERYPFLKTPEYSFRSVAKSIAERQDELKLSFKDIQMMFEQTIVSTKHPCESLSHDFLAVVSSLYENTLLNLKRNTFNSFALYENVRSMFSLPYLEIRKPAGPRSQASVNDVIQRLTSFNYRQRDGTIYANSRFRNEFSDLYPDLSINVQYSSWKFDVDGDFLVNSSTLLAIHLRQVVESSNLYKSSDSLSKVNVTFGQFLDQFYAHLQKFMESQEVNEGNLSQIPENYQNALMLVPNLNKQRMKIESLLRTTIDTNGKEGYKNPDKLLNDISKMIELIERLDLDIPEMKAVKEATKAFRDWVSGARYKDCQGQHRQEGQIFYKIICEIFRSFINPDEYEEKISDLQFWIKVYRSILYEEEKPAELEKMELRLEECPQYQNIFDFCLAENGYFTGAPLLDDNNFGEHIHEFERSICKQELEFINMLSKGQIDRSSIDTIISSQNDNALHLISAKIFFKLANLEVLIGPLGENRKALRILPGEIEILDQALGSSSDACEVLEANLKQLVSSENFISLPEREKSLTVYENVRSWFLEFEKDITFLYQLGYSDNAKLVGAIGAKDGLMTCISSLYDVLNGAQNKIIQDIAGEYLHPIEVRKIQVFCNRLISFLGLGTTPGRSGAVVREGGIRDDFPNIFRHFGGKYLGRHMWTIQGNGKTFNQLSSSLWSVVLERTISGQAGAILDYLLNDQEGSPVLTFLGERQKDNIESFIFGEFLNEEFGFSLSEDESKLAFLDYFNIFLFNGTLGLAKTGLRPGFRRKPKDADDNRAIGTQMAQLASSYNYTVIFGVPLEDAFQEFGGPEGFLQQLNSDKHLNITFGTLLNQLRVIDWEFIEYSVAKLLSDDVLPLDKKKIIGSYFIKMIQDFQSILESIRKIPGYELFLANAETLDPEAERIEWSKKHARPWRLQLLRTSILARSVKYEEERIHKTFEQLMLKVDLSMKSIGLKSVLDEVEAEVIFARNSLAKLSEKRTVLSDKVSVIRGAIQSILWLSG